MSTTTGHPLRLAIAGLGAIGMSIARRVDAGGIEGMTLAAVSVRDQQKAQGRLSDFANPPELLPLDALGDRADVIVECVPAAHFLEVARPALEKGRIFMPLSVGVLLTHMELVDLAREKGARIIVPTGALIGLDAVRAAASGGIGSVKLVTRYQFLRMLEVPAIIVALVAFWIDYADRPIERAVRNAQLLAQVAQLATIDHANATGGIKAILEFLADEKVSMRGIALVGTRLSGLDLERAARQPFRPL